MKNSTEQVNKQVATTEGNKVEIDNVICEQPLQINLVFTDEVVNKANGNSSNAFIYTLTMRTPGDEQAQITGLLLSDGIISEKNQPKTYQMKIRYKKKRLYRNLFMGIVWFIFALITLTFDKENKWLDYGYVVLALLYLGQYTYEYFQQYLTIENGTIKKNAFFGKQLQLDKIIWIKKFAGEYTLLTNTQKLTIETNWIEEKSLQELHSVLEKLDLPPEKTPFTNTVYN